MKIFEKKNLRIFNLHILIIRFLCKLDFSTQCNMRQAKISILQICERKNVRKSDTNVIDIRPRQHGNDGLNFY